MIEELIQLYKYYCYRYSDCLKLLILIYLLVVNIDIQKYQFQYKHIFFVIFSIFILGWISYIENKESIYLFFKNKLIKLTITILSTLVTFYVYTLASYETMNRTGFPLNFFSFSIQPMFITILVILILIIISIVLIILSIIYEFKLFISINKWKDGYLPSICHLAMICIPTIIGHLTFNGNFFKFINEKYPYFIEFVLVETSYSNILKHCDNRIDLLNKYGKDIKIAVIDSKVISVAKMENSNYIFETDICQRKNIN